MLKFIWENLSDPEIVPLSHCFKDIYLLVESTSWIRNSSVRTISQVNCTISTLSRIVSEKRFRSFEGVYVIFVGGDDSVSIEVWNPVEYRLKDSSSSLINIGANAIDRNMVVNEFIVVRIFLEPFNQKGLLPASEIVEVPRIKGDIDHVREFVVENRTSLTDRGNFLHNIVVGISLIVLREEIEELRAFQVLGNIYPGIFVKSGVVISYGQDNGEDVPGFLENFFELADVEIPCVVAGIEVVVVGDITSDEKDIRVERSEDLVEQNGRPGRSGVSSVDHRDILCRVVRDSLVDILVLDGTAVEDLEDVFGIRGQIRN